MGWLSWLEHNEGIQLRHAWHPLGEQYLKDAYVWADGYHEETRTVFNFRGCMFHGHLHCDKNPYQKHTYNARLKKSMGDLDLETQRWERRVKDSKYKIRSVYECQWRKELKEDDRKREHVENLGMAGVISSRSALYGGRTETIALHAVGDKRHPIKYIDVVSSCAYFILKRKYRPFVLDIL